MAKIIKAENQNKCIGCEMCVFECQRQMKKVGIEGSLIRIFKKSALKEEGIKFQVEVDPRINKLNLQKIKDICPTKVFEIEEEKDD